MAAILCVTCKAGTLEKMHCNRVKCEALLLLEACLFSCGFAWSVVQHNVQNCN